MNSPLRKVAAGLLLLFAVLLVNANYLQVGQAHSLVRDPHNRRLLVDRYQHMRGPIVVGGSAIATSVATNDALKYLRRYPGGTLFAPITGYYSFTAGVSEIERSYDDLLSGEDPRLLTRKLSDYLVGRPVQGGSVTLTIDQVAQSTAAQALGNHRGAVVALDPATGAVLALVTSPSYDPATVSTHDPNVNTAAYQKLLDDPAQPLLDRATAARYPPGSLFKVVTAAAALSSGQYTPETLIDAPAQLTLPGTTTTLGNFAGETCGNSPKITLSFALQVSCNTAFARLGLDLGASILGAQAKAFGIGDTIDGWPLDYARSVFPDNIDAPQTALSAIGQFDVALTPLQAAMIMAAIGNKGHEMKPFVVAQTQSPTLAPLDTAQPAEIGQPVSENVAAQLTAMMTAVVTSGTGTAAQLGGVSVAGKTGTAQHGAGLPPYAWFGAFAPADAPRIAVAVFVEDGGPGATGGTLAAPIAQQVMSAYLNERR